MQTAQYKLVSIISQSDSIQIYVGGIWFRYTKKADERFSVCQHDKTCQPPRNGDFVDIALNNLTYALKRPNLQLEKLVLTLEASEFDEQFLQLFESLNSPIHLKFLNINARGDMDVVRILSTLKPGTLESIDIANWQTAYHSKEVVKMEQWKQAKQIHLPWTNKIPFGVKEFVHFNRIRCFFIHESAMTISPEDVILLREAFSKSSGFEYCDIGLSIVNSMAVADIGRALGATVERDLHGSEFIRHRHPITGSNEFLLFRITNRILLIERKR